MGFSILGLPTPSRALRILRHENEKDSKWGAYVVRVIENRELVGIYFAPNVATLADLVDVGGAGRWWR